MQKFKTTGLIHDTPTGYDFTQDDALTPKKAIRLRCLDCCGGSSHEVRLCPAKGCGLWPHRLPQGLTKDPEGKVKVERERSEAQKAADARNAERLRAMRADA